MAQFDFLEKQCDALCEALQKFEHTDFGFPDKPDEFCAKVYQGNPAIQCCRRIKGKRSYHVYKDTTGANSEEIDKLTKQEKFTVLQEFLRKELNPVIREFTRKSYKYRWFSKEDSEDDSDDDSDEQGNKKKKRKLKHIEVYDPIYEDVVYLKTACSIETESQKIKYDPNATAIDEDMKTRIQRHNRREDERNGTISQICGESLETLPEEIFERARKKQTIVKHISISLFGDEKENDSDYENDEYSTCKSYYAHIHIKRLVTYRGNVITILGGHEGLLVKHHHTGNNDSDSDDDTESSSSNDEDTNDKKPKIRPNEEIYPPHRFRELAEYIFQYNSGTCLLFDYNKETK
jgi:hypothetical protein